jgi:hypothetical protein
MSTLKVTNIQSNGSGFNDVVSFQNSSGTQNGTLCRTWVNFNGTGTVAIRASFNVSSITDNGTGDYTVNFATTLADANYVAVLTHSNSSSNADFAILSAGQGGADPTSSTIRIRSATNGNVTDTAFANVAIFR